jgi:hypothetical protein
MNESPTLAAPAEQPDYGYVGFADFDPRALILAVQYIVTCGVQGDIAEFGCYQGRSAEVIARALYATVMKYATNEILNETTDRTLWLFDSFEGFPEVDNLVDSQSPHIKNRIWGPGVARGGSPDAVRKLCNRFVPTVVVPGWFKDTVKAIPAPRKFALIHVDCDYYESTMDALEPLFARNMIADGATILFDDWYCNCGSPKFGQQKAWQEISDRYCIPGRGGNSDWGAYGITGRRFIVHVEG